jgi:drug/metabolite transporter (DMT)-like permease
MLAVLLGLGASLCWGASDFLGGVATRRRPLLTVVLVTQLAGLAAAALLVGAGSVAPPPALALGLAALAGLVGAAALAAFYAGLAIGTIAVVAPIASTSVAVPVLVGIAGGDRPSAPQLLGILAAVVGVVLATRQASAAGPRRHAEARSVVLALVAALGIGLFMVAFAGAADRASHAGVLWLLVAARCASIAAFLAAAAVVRPALALTPAEGATLVLVGILDVAANGMFALGSTLGLLSLVAVLASLYPAVTVLLARLRLEERVRRVQEVGVVLTLAGVVLIAS